MSTEFDYYAVLGVRSTAPLSEIKQQYHHLAKLYHPDANPGEEEECSRHMVIVNEAYRVLSHPRERTKYDMLRKAEHEQTANGGSYSQWTGSDTSSSRADRSWQPSNSSSRTEPPRQAPASGWADSGWRPPKIDPASMAERPRSRVREVVIATVAGVLLVGGIVAVTYNLITPASTVTTVSTDSPPISVQYTPPPSPAPKTSTPGKVEASAGNNHVEPAANASGEGGAVKKNAR